jgi:oxalate decarboxylase/phosphoglucose isomerase-like protein (cupin superfamily)
MGMYHWEADQEDFFVLSGEALLLVEEEERPLRQWDIVHCPPGTKHIIIGAGDEPCMILAIGARSHQDNDGWGAYTVSELALRHGTGVEEETIDSELAYAKVPHRKPAPFREDWLPS